MSRPWSEAVRAITRVRRQIPDAARDALEEAGRVGVRSAQRNASGRVLKRRSGRLAASVRHKVTLDNGRAVLRLSTDSPYGRIHEMGGRIQGRPWLVFRVPGGGWRKVREVTIPARPWLRPALQDASASRGVEPCPPSHRSAPR